MMKKQNKEREFMEERAGSVEAIQVGLMFMALFTFGSQLDGDENRYIDGHSHVHTVTHSGNGRAGCDRT